MPTSKSGTANKKKRSSRKRRSSVTARRFFDPVVLVLGEKSNFTANTPVPMAEVQEEVLRRVELTDKERKAHDDKYLKRRVEFAFRNRRAKYVRGLEALTVLVDGKGGQWGLTEAGVAKARELAGDAPETPEVEEAAAPEVEEPEAEAPVEAPVEEDMPSLEEVLQSVEEEGDLPPEPDPKPEKKPKRKRTRGPRTLSGAIGGGS